MGGTGHGGPTGRLPGGTGPNLPLECGKCKKRFIKEAGCNMMTCACGAKMCYVCKQNITGYQHFGTKCSLHSDTNAIHETDVKRAAADAKQQLDPNIKLIHDPTKDVL
ncbi:hypothetical protein SK128_015052 [Halocaridina rubra]|uniref:Uncharacterized protein n=1 Tax=Halocaridina rubra TaxID=373956 RepID=A0AAN8XFQ4_HALRR